MPTEFQWPVSSYSVTMLSNGFGWIQLKDGEEDAGYIYVNDRPNQKDRFGGIGGPHPYIVMHQPLELWQTLLDVLRNEGPLYIRGYQPEGGEVSAFFGTNTEEPVGEGE